LSLICAAYLLDGFDGEFQSNCFTDSDPPGRMGIAMDRERPIKTFWVDPGGEAVDPSRRRRASAPAEPMPLAISHKSTTHSATTTHNRTTDCNHSA